MTEEEKAILKKQIMEELGATQTQAPAEDPKPTPQTDNSEIEKLKAELKEKESMLKESQDNLKKALSTGGSTKNAKIKEVLGLKD